MSTIPNVRDLLEGHITLSLESIDRLYLNGYLPQLQHGAGLVQFLCQHREQPIASPALLGQITGKFVAEVKSFATQQAIPLFHFERKESKDLRAHQMRRERPVRDAVVFIGIAQEKAHAFSAHRLPGKRAVFEFTRNKSVLPNYYYFYLDDADWGECFIKVCSYAPWGLKLYLNGHEWLKRQLSKEGIDFESLDNGFLSCQNPQRLQALANALGPEHIEAFCKKWLNRLPMPLSAQDRTAGYDYRLSIWQMEFSLTQIVDRPMAGRQFFEEVIRDNLDLGRPDRIQLIFPRKIIRTTPGSFRTRVLREGVHPSLHISYKRFDLKQYFKGRSRTAYRRHLPRSERFRGQQGNRKYALPQRSGPPDQPTPAGSRACQPELWFERREHPKGGATNRDTGRSTSAGFEVWRSAGDGVDALPVGLRLPNRRISQPGLAIPSGSTPGCRAGPI